MEHSRGNAPPAEPLPTARELGLTALEHHATVDSTMDEAHARARAGAPAGLLVVADRQQAGRGRGGKRWTSGDASGLWMTLLERPRDAAVLRVLSLRLGLEIADAVQPFAPGDVRVKWPNDLYVGEGKLAGILVEARWREQVVDWVAIGFGINLRVPSDVPGTSTLREGVSRAQLLRALVPRMRAAATGPAELTASELACWNARDLARGRRASSPVAGVVRGITADGALCVRVDPTADEAARDVAVHAGSLLLEPPAAVVEPEHPGLPC